MNTSKRYEQYMYSYPHKNAYKMIEKQVLAESFKRMQEEELTLYVHIPFCTTKCGYCNLFSVVASARMIEAYLEAVCRQMRQYSEQLKGKNITVTNVILGGGTPLVLSMEQFDTLFQAIEHYFQLDLTQCHFDIETSPNETTKEKLEYLKRHGMRRISIGIQSFHQEELKKVYRHHEVERCHEALRYLKEINPLCLNIDLIYGIEGQTIESFEASIEEALYYNPDEIFMYPLYIREDTAIFHKMTADEELQYKMYQHGTAYLKDRGYRQTSMRRFTRGNQLEDASCGFEQVLALGCGGRSYLGNVHFCEPYEVNSNMCRNILTNYIQKGDFLDGVKGYVLNQDEQMRRFVIKNLGFYRGVSISEFEAYFKRDLWLEYQVIWEELKENGLICAEHDFICLTEKGMGDSDRILARWISEEVKRGMQNDGRDTGDNL